MASLGVARQKQKQTKTHKQKQGRKHKERRNWALKQMQRPEAVEGRRKGVSDEKRVLLVGEADFSFCLALARTRNPRCENLFCYELLLFLVHLLRRALVRQSLLRPH